jgi:type 1 glutamine amidotransferase
MRGISVFVAAVLCCAAATGKDGPPEAPLRIHMLSGSREYKSEESLTAFKGYLEKRYPVRCTLSLGRDGVKEFPNLQPLEKADVLLVFCRRTKITGQQLERIQRWCKAGKPVVGLRTASHAFQTWLAFDKEVLGGDYKGHGGNDPDVKLTIPQEAKAHPVLKGIKPWKRAGKLYRNPKPAEDITLLLTATGRKDSQPVAWVRTQKNGGRVFYTSMGLPTDFQNQTFRDLMVNAIFWTARRKVPPARQGNDEPAEERPANAM